MSRPKKITFAASVPVEDMGYSITLRGLDLHGQPVEETISASRETHVALFGEPDVQISIGSADEPA